MPGAPPSAEAVLFVALPRWHRYGGRFGAAFEAEGWAELDDLFDESSFETSGGGKSQCNENEATPEIRGNLCLCMLIGKTGLGT